MEGQKSGRSRPVKQKFFSGIELREKALESIRASTKKRLALDELDVIDFCNDASNITGKHKFTKEEMDSIRERVDFIYRDAVEAQHQVEEEANTLYAEALRDIAIQSETSSQSLMTREQWFKEHDLRPDGSRKRGPKPKRKKKFYEVEPGDKGLATAPSEPVDIEAMEQELLNEIYAEHQREKEARHPNTFGKRLRPDASPARSTPSPKSFWI